SNIQRPFIRFQMLRPSGRMAFECAEVTKTHGGNAVVKGFGAIVNRGEKIVLVGRNGLGKTTLLKALLADAPGLPASPGDVDRGSVRWGHEVSIRSFRHEHPRSHA